MKKTNTKITEVKTIKFNNLSKVIDLASNND